MKKTSIGAVIVSTALVLAGCGSESSGGSDGAEKINFTTSTQFPPMAFMEDNELKGFEIDFGTALAERAGFEVEWTKSKFSQFLSDVNSNRADAILGGMQDLPDRQGDFDWIDYLQTGYQFYTTDETAESESISELEDFCGLTVAASRNASYRPAIEEWSAANCNGDEIVVLDSDGSPDALLQLRQGRAQGVVQTVETVVYGTEQDDALEMVGDPFTTDYYGLGIKSDNDELQDRLREAFNEMIEDGTYEEIASDWSLGDQIVDRVTVNLEGRDDADAAK